MGSSPIPSAGTVIPTPGQPRPMQPGEWQGSASPTVVSFEKYDVNPPSFVYIGPGEQLVVNVNAIPFYGETITVCARLLLPEPPRTGQPDGTGGPPPPSSAPPSSAITGQPAPAGSGPHPHRRGPAAVIEQLQLIIPVTGGTPATGVLTLPEGYLLSVAAISANTPNLGTVFVRAFLQQRAGPGGAIQPAMILFAGYCTKFQPIGWPGGRFAYPAEGPGSVQETIVAQPAAGADWSYTFPAIGRYRVQQMCATFVTSAAAGNRIPRIQVFGYSGVVTWWAGPQAFVVPSASVKVNAASTCITTTVDGSSIHLPLPSPLIMGSGEILQVSTTGLQAGDQWSSIVLTIEQWVDKI